MGRVTKPSLLPSYKDRQSFGDLAPKESFERAFGYVSLCNFAQFADPSALSQATTHLKPAFYLIVEAIICYCKGNANGGNFGVNSPSQFCMVRDANKAEQQVCSSHEELEFWGHET